MPDVMVLIAFLPIIHLGKPIIWLFDLRSARNLVKLMILISFL